MHFVNPVTIRRRKRIIRQVSEIMAMAQLPTASMHTIKWQVDIEQTTLDELPRFTVNIVRLQRCADVGTLPKQTQLIIYCGKVSSMHGSLSMLRLRAASKLLAYVSTYYTDKVAHRSYVER